MTPDPEDNRGGSTRSVSIVVPTFREAENLTRLIESVREAGERRGFSPELIIVDDNSEDGTARVVEELALDWVRLEVRRGERGLSTAVLRGVELASHDTVVVMDADLSHPPESIGDLLRELDRGAEFVIGSRFVPGGSTADDWGFARRLNALVARLCCRPLVDLHDPMSGFFSFRRDLLDRADTLDPVGYKIGLEILVRARVPHERIREVPIHFSQRSAGKSKLNPRQQALYLEHIRRLIWFRNPVALVLFALLALVLIGGLLWIAVAALV